MIFILESPSGKDLFEKRKEGNVLSEALCLSGIKCSYFLVVNREILKSAFKEIEKEILGTPNPLISLPYIHLSAHGNENGFALTDGDFLNWEDFKKILLELNRKIGYIDLSRTLRISKIVLCMSVCEGLNLRKISELQPKPFQAIVGNLSKIYWSDALTAFLIFYHNAIFKGISTKESVRRMNIGSGVETEFELHIDDEIKNR